MKKVQKKKKRNVKDNNKIHKLTLILIVIAILLFIINILLTLFRNSSNEKIANDDIEKTYFNNSSNITESKEVDGMVFSNILLVYEDNQSKLTMDVINTTENDYNNQFWAKFNDENGNEITSLLLSTNEILKSGETKQLVASTNGILMDAKNLEIVKG